MRKVIKRFSEREILRSRELQDRLKRKDWKSLGVRGATLVEIDPVTKDILFIKETPDKPKK